MKMDITCKHSDCDWQLRDKQLDGKKNRALKWNYRNNLCPIRIENCITGTISGPRSSSFILHSDIHDLKLYVTLETCWLNLPRTCLHDETHLNWTGLWNDSSVPIWVTCSFCNHDNLPTSCIRICISLFFRPLISQPLCICVVQFDTYKHMVSSCPYSWHTVLIVTFTGVLFRQD